MGRVISFEDRALAHLRARVAAAEEANQDLIAFARGHSGAVASIHAAVLAAIEAEGLDHLIHIVTQEWPQILGLDAVAVALWAGETGVRADASGLQFVNPRLIERWITRGSTNCSPEASARMPLSPANKATATASRPRICGQSCVTMWMRWSKPSDSTAASTASWIEATAPEWPRAKAMRS